MQRLTMDLPQSRSALLVRVPGALCALPLTEVIETMRPLPVESLANTPDFIRGVARIRGAAVPVVELTALFQAEYHDEVLSRFVTLRVGPRCVALAVQSVVGVADVSDQIFDNLPPLLKTKRSELIEALGTLDAEFLVTLHTARLVPDAVWHTLAHTKAMP